MNIKSVINKLAEAFGESIYIRKYKRGIRRNTVFCDRQGIEIPSMLKTVRKPYNAEYILTDKPLPDRFIKKQGQKIAVVCNFAHNEFFGRFQRTMLMSDFLLCGENADISDIMREFEIDGIYDGCAVGHFDKRILCDILNGKFSSHKSHHSKKRVLLYSGSLAQNGLTASLLNLLSNLENDCEYMITYRENSLKGSPERLEKIPHNFRKIPVSGGFIMSVSELLCYILYFKLDFSGGLIKKRIDRLFKREWARLYGALSVDTAVQFTGYEYGVIKLFESFDGNRVIFVHNDMVQEIKQRHNQHLLTLRQAYRNYNTVALVTEDMRAPTLEICGTQDNFRIVPNCHDYKTVLNKSTLPMEFQPETECNISFGELEKIMKSDREKFITIGRFSAEKAHMRLIDAFGDYCRKFPEKETVLIIIGGRGVLYDKTVEYAEKSGLPVILIRSMENPMPILKQCSLFMLPSEYEGLGLVMLEADTLGVPVFATDVPGPGCFLSEYGGHLAKNSREGIFDAMCLFEKGEIKPMNIDFESYNRYAVTCFKNIL